MSRLPKLRTPRLLLRTWRDADLAPFAEMNADAAVVEFLGSPLSRAESDALAASIRAHFDRHGFGLWAVEVAGSGQFAGFIGLSVPAFEAPFTPCVEVGWRLGRLSARAPLPCSIGTLRSVFFTFFPGREHCSRPRSGGGRRKFSFHGLTPMIRSDSS